MARFFPTPVLMAERSSMPIGLRKISTVSCAPQVFSFSASSRSTTMCLQACFSPTSYSASMAIEINRSDSRGGSKPQRVNTIIPSSVR